MVKNPLKKRLLRELKSDFGKYFVIFAFLVLLIAFCSGFFVATESMQQAFDGSFEKYNVENGHIIFNEKPANEIVKDIEENQNVKLYEIFYKEVERDNEDTIRIYKNRADVDKICVMEGELANKADEIALDRMYASNANLKVGDTVRIEGKDYRITGLIAMSDYTSLFKSNTDLMFDAQHFSVAQVSDAAFEALPDYSINYCYAWKYQNDVNTDKERETASDDLKDALVEAVKAENVKRAYAGELENFLTISDFVPEQDNQAIHFAGDDIGGDKSMITVLLYIVIIILAFIFGVTTMNTIEKESAVIGTLRASGYTKKELIIHFMELPVIVLVIGAVVGNIIGYTGMKYVCADMYYGSYSLPAYVTVWNGWAFVATTVVPVILLVCINFFMLVKMFRLSPLKFLRHDLSKKRKRKAVKLPNWRFLARFRTRIILQNKSSYLIMFIGIAFSNIILLFGLVMTPLLDNYKKLVVDSMPCAYQYVLKTKTETKTAGVEKYALTSLDYVRAKDLNDEVSVYGLQDNSKYFEIDFENDGVYISDGVAEKYGFKVGDTITLNNEMEDEEYSFAIAGIHTYPSSLAVFMPIENFRTTFDKADDYYSGYLSNVRIEDIAEENIALTITQDDMTIVADQLSDSMGRMFYLLIAFALLIYLIVVYLLSKVVIEKNANAISIVKILGYQNGDVFRLYVVSTIIVVAISLVITIPLSDAALGGLWKAIMSSYPGWLSYKAPAYVLVEMPLIGVVAYVVIGLLEYRRIGRIPMETALKNVE
jgi:putative ABC transport system permease protein